MAGIAAALAVSSAALFYLGTVFSGFVGFFLFILSSFPGVLLLLLVVAWSRSQKEPRDAFVKIERIGVEWTIDGALWRRLHWSEIVKAPNGGHDLRYLDLGDEGIGIGFFVREKGDPRFLIIAPFINLFPLPESYHLPYFRNALDLRFSFLITFARARPDLAIDPEVFVGLRIDPRTLSYTPRAFRKVVVRRAIANLVLVIVSFSGMGSTIYALTAPNESVKAVPPFLIILIGSALSLYLGFKIHSVIYDDGHHDHRSEWPRRNHASQRQGAHRGGRRNGRR